MDKLGVIDKPVFVLVERKVTKLEYFLFSKHGIRSQASNKFYKIQMGLAFNIDQCKQVAGEGCIGLSQKGE